MLAKSIIRFGRRIPIPSTVQVRHDYRVYCEEREARELCAAEEGLPSEASRDDIILHWGDRTTPVAPRMVL